MSKKTETTIKIDGAKLGGYSDEFLAACWHAAQWNPAPHGEHAAGELAERISREIIRRWLRGVPPRAVAPPGPRLLPGRAIQDRQVRAG